MKLLYLFLILMAFLTLVSAQPKKPAKKPPAKQPTKTVKTPPKKPVVKAKTKPVEEKKERAKVEDKGKEQVVEPVKATTQQETTQESEVREELTLEEQQEDEDSAQIRAFICDAAVVYHLAVAEESLKDYKGNGEQLMEKLKARILAKCYTIPLNDLTVFNSSSLMNESNAKALEDIYKNIIGATIVDYADLLTSDANLELTPEEEGVMELFMNDIVKIEEKIKEELTDKTDGSKKGPKKHESL